MNLSCRIIIFCALSFAIISCSKSKVAPEYDYGPFNYNNITSIQSNGSVVIELKQGSSNSVIRKTIGGPQITYIGGMLTLNGGGTVTIGAKDPLAIQLNSGGLKTSGAIKMKQLSIYEQMATVNLDSITVDSVLTVSLMNMGDCQIKGKTSYLIVSTTNYPAFFGFGLESDSCLVSHMGLSDVQVNVTRKLTGAIYSMGNLFYKGNPAVVNVSKTGTGKLVPY